MLPAPIIANVVSIKSISDIELRCSASILSSGLYSARIQFDYMPVLEFKALVSLIKLHSAYIILGWFCWVFVT
jgi:hypothetical protein